MNRPKQDTQDDTLAQSAATVADAGNAAGKTDDLPTTALVKDALDGARELVRLEVKLAKEEVKDEVKSVSHAAIGFGVAAASSLLTLTMLAVALVLAIGPSPWAALIVAGGFLVVCAVAAIIGYAKIPTNPLARTRRRVESDVNQLKEHVA